MFSPDELTILRALTDGDYHFASDLLKELKLDIKDADFVAMIRRWMEEYIVRRFGGESWLQLTPKGRQAIWNPDAEHPNPRRPPR